MTPDGFLNIFIDIVIILILIVLISSLFMLRRLSDSMVSLLKHFNVAHEEKRIIPERVKEEDKPGLWTFDTAKREMVRNGG